jgi:branched-chain amino acid transport system substrate-binding protein
VRNTRRRVIASAAIAAVGLVAGCSSSSKSTSAGSSSSASSSAGSTASSSSSAVSSAAGSSSAVGSAGGSSAATGTPVHVLVSASVSATGTLGQNAKTTVAAVKGAASVLNAKGGIDGHPIQVTVVDDQGTPTVAVSKLQQALSGGTKPDVYFDAGPSNVSEAVLPILTQNKIMSFNTAPTADSGDASKFPYNYDMSPSSTNYAVAFCPYAKTQGWTKVGILYTDDAYGDVLGPAIKDECVKDGSTVTGISKYDPTALDYTATIQSIQSGNPQAVVLVGYGAEVGYMLTGINKLGWNVPILGDIAVADTSTITTPPPAGTLGTDLQKTLVMEVFKSVAKSDNQPAALNAMIAAMNSQGGLSGPLISAYPYDGLMLFAAAATKAGTVTDATKIAPDVIGLTDAGTGIFPQYFYTATSHEPNQPADAFTFVKPSVVQNGQYGG